MEGGSDKRCITGTFSITFSNKLLPVQLIYDGKTVQSLPRFKFPQEFSLSANPTQFSNSSESIKLFEEVIIPYHQKERKKLITDPQSLDYYGCFRRTDDVRSTYYPQRQYLSRQYSTKHDKILSKFGLNGQRTCDTLLEKEVQHMPRELNFETTP